MKVLLSIKPEFAFKIIEGSKLFEFRKVLFKKEVKSVIVYASSPVQKVIGEFEIGGIISDTPDKVWEKTKEYAGISKPRFDSHFNQKSVAQAIEIKTPEKYSSQLSLKDNFNVNSAPQSFRYLRD